MNQLKGASLLKYNNFLFRLVDVEEKKVCGYQWKGKNVNMCCIEIFFFSQWKRRTKTSEGEISNFCMNESFQSRLFFEWILPQHLRTSILLHIFTFSIYKKLYVWKHENKGKSTADNNSLASVKEILILNGWIEIKKFHKNH